MISLLLLAVGQNPAATWAWPNQFSPTLSLAQSNEGPLAGPVNPTP
jgi:hypothetical protein